MVRGQIDCSPGARERLVWMGEERARLDTPRARAQQQLDTMGECLACSHGVAGEVHGGGGVWSFRAIAVGGCGVSRREGW